MTKSGKIVVTTATMENPLCPTIYVGHTDDGATVYARFRWGRLSLRVDTRNPAPNGGADGHKIFDLKIDPNGMDGNLSYDDLREHTTDIITWPDDLTPREYDEGDMIDL